MGLGKVSNCLKCHYLYLYIQGVYELRKTNASESAGSHRNWEKKLLRFIIMHFCDFSILDIFRVLEEKNTKKVLRHKFFVRLKNFVDPLCPVIRSEKVVRILFVCSQTFVFYYRTFFNPQNSYLMWGAWICFINARILTLPPRASRPTIIIAIFQCE